MRDKLQWNVYIANVNYVEGNGIKLRPVLVLNDPVGSYKIVLVAPIYSVKPDHKLMGDVSISDDRLDMGLIRPSTIRLHRIVSLPASDLKEQIGQTPPEFKNIIKSELRALLDL